MPAPDRIEMMTLLKDAMQDVRINESSDFKSVWVTNALDGSEDYLVRDNIFSLVGEGMRGFRAEMLKKSPPRAIKEVIHSIIPPQGIRREKNTEASELLDGEEMGEEDAENDEEVNTDQLLEALQSNDNIPIETWNEEPPRESNTVSGNAISLVVSAKMRISIKMRNSLMKLVKFSKSTKRLQSILHREICYRIRTKMQGEVSRNAFKIHEYCAVHYLTSLIYTFN